MTFHSLCELARAHRLSVRRSHLNAAVSAPAFMFNGASIYAWWFGLSRPAHYLHLIDFATATLLTAFRIPACMFQSCPLCMFLFRSLPAASVFAYPRPIRCLSSCAKSRLKGKPNVYLSHFRRRRCYASIYSSASFSTVVPTTRIPDSVEIPCRSNGSILLK